MTISADSRRAPGIWSLFTCTRTAAGGRTVPSRDTTVRPPAPGQGLFRGGGIRDVRDTDDTLGTKRSC